MLMYEEKNIGSNLSLEKSFFDFDDIISEIEKTNNYKQDFIEDQFSDDMIPCVGEPQLAFENYLINTNQEHANEDLDNFIHLLKSEADKVKEMGYDTWYTQEYESWSYKNNVEPEEAHTPGL